MVSHLSVVASHRDDKTHEGLVVESLKAKKVDKHEQRLFHLLLIVHVECVERESANVDNELAKAGQNRLIWVTDERVA